MKKMLSSLTIERAIPQLVATYNKGKLIPFTGAGISAPRVSGWRTFLKNICDINELPYELDDNASSQQLIQFSEKIVSTLCKGEEGRFERSVKGSLGYGSAPLPEVTDQCANLAKIVWPMVMTTNYDTMFVDEYNKRHQRPEGDAISVFGRNQVDCHSLLSLLAAPPAQTAYWALQGYFGNSQNGIPLEGEIVVGYRQYRSATFNNATFRAVFGEVFRNYSLLFLGSGLTEDYFMGLFGEVLERFGSTPHTHCAVFHEDDKGKIDSQFLHSRFNILPVFYEDKYQKYDGLGYFLDTLAESIEGKSNKMWTVGFSNKSLADPEKYDAVGGLEISASAMPELQDGECNVFSAGYDTKIHLSGKGKTFIGDSYDPSKFHRLNNSSCWQYEDTPIYAAVARNSVPGRTSYESRDLRTVSTALFDVLELLGNKYSTINIMLLAASTRRVYPPVYSLIEMLRGYKKYVKQNKLHCKLRIHVFDPLVISYVRRMPLEIEDILGCDEIRLSIEIHDGREIERYQIYLYERKKMVEISEYFSLKDDFWDVRILPTPYRDQQVFVSDEQTLEDLGIIPGSTIIYSRKKRS